MERNQTAKELAKHYEKCAIKSANDYWKLRANHPFEDFIIQDKAIEFYCTLYDCWIEVSKLRKRNG